jgi:uncharacterized BrkB/YihY/UPF0761 family membrane protein
MDIVQEQVNRLVSKGDAKLGVGFIVGLLVALWSANAGMKAIMDALNVVYDEKEKRGFIKLNLVSLAFTIAVLAAVLLAISAVVVVPIILNFVGLAVYSPPAPQLGICAHVRTTLAHTKARFNYIGPRSSSRRRHADSRTILSAVVPSAPTRIRAYPMLPCARPG